MFRLIWTASVRIHNVLSYAPTNLLLAAIHTRRGLKWGVPAMLLAVPYGAVVSLCGTAVENGGPGWLNLVLLLAAWDMLKFVIMGPVSVILLMRARLREAVGRRRERRPDEREGIHDAVGVNVTSS
jgi:hypothetical protein